MIEERKEIEFVAKLIQLTQAKRIEWQFVEDDNKITADPTAQAFDIYHTEVDGERLRLYQLTAMGLGPYADDRDLPYWATATVLELLGDKGKVLWSIRHVPGLAELLRSIKFVSGQVENRIEKIMKLPVSLGT
jgi:hypothetical protein